MLKTTSTLTFLEHNRLVVRYFLKSCGIPCNTGGEDHVIICYNGMYYRL